MHPPAPDLDPELSPIATRRRSPWWLAVAVGVGAGAIGYAFAFALGCSTGCGTGRSPLSFALFTGFTAAVAAASAARQRDK